MAMDETEILAALARTIACFKVKQEAANAEIDRRHDLLIEARRERDEAYTQCNDVSNRFTEARREGCAKCNTERDAAEAKLAESERQLNEAWKTIAELGSQISKLQPTLFCTHDEPSAEKQAEYVAGWKDLPPERT